VCLIGCGDDALSLLGEESTGLDLQANATLPDNTPLVATELYGPLYVKSGELTAESTTKPWSSWWFPVWQDTLFARTSDGDPAPLEKYDRYCRKALWKNTSAAEFERTQIYDARAEGWGGLCHAWALASIMTAEPARGVTRNGIHFTVADLKALLLKTYENVPDLKHFGRRNFGNWDDNYADIAPDQFHSLLQAELFKKGLPFLMDYDAGEEVWYAPVWKASTRITQDKKQPDVVHVETWLLSASADVDKNYVGTQAVSRRYTYDLVGTWQADQRFLVKSGQWTDRSRWDHPDYLIAKPETVKRASRNSQIDAAVVDAIVDGINAPRSP
jgi:hypothetical protein